MVGPMLLYSSNEHKCTMPTTPLQTLCLLQYAQALQVHMKTTLQFSD